MDESAKRVYPRTLVWRVRMGIAAALFVARFALWSALSGAFPGVRIRIDARLIGFHALAGQIESRTGRAAERVWC